MFVPGYKLLKELQNERAGLWIIRADNEDTASMVVKLPTPAIKAIYRGAQLSLVVSVVELKRVRMRLLGLRIDDDITYPYYAMGPSRGASELTLLREILMGTEAWMHFFDEPVRPIMSAKCIVDKKQNDKLLADLTRTSPHFGGQSIKITDDALDIFDDDIDAIYYGLPLKSLLAYTLPIIITSTDLVNIHEVNKGSFRLDNVDEGGGLEQSIHGSLEIVFGDDTFRSPLVKDGNKERELTDLMGFNDECVCIIESKALSILGGNLIRPTERRIHSIEKDITELLQILADRFVMR